MPREKRIRAARDIVDAAYSSRMEPIATAPKERDRTLLLYCCEQGGWRTGTWSEDEQRWIAISACDETLDPSHWADPPPMPVDCEAPQKKATLMYLAKT